MLVEIIIDQRVVELLAKQDVEAESRLVEHQQLCVDRHHQRQVKLRDHALRQLADTTLALDRRLCQKPLRLRAIEPRMHAFDVIERLPHAQPSRQHRNVADERDVQHQLVALGPGIAAQHLQRPFERDETEDRVQHRALAGAVGSDQSDDAAAFDRHVDVIECDTLSESFGQPVGFDAMHLR